MPRSCSKKSPSKMLSRSAPTSPKNLHDLNKSSTLPPPRLTGGTRGSASTSGGSSNSGSGGAKSACSGNASASPRKSRSATLSNFLRKLSPKLRQGTSKGREKSWYVVEIAQRDGGEQDGELVFEADVKQREQVLPPFCATNSSTSTCTKDAEEHADAVLDSRFGESSAKGTPNKMSTNAAGKAGGDEKQLHFKTAPKKSVQEAVSKKATPRLSEPQMSKAFTMDQTKEQVQPGPAAFSSQPLIRINSNSVASPGENLPTGPRVRRLHQPPRTLNILNKIVVHPPTVEKVKGKMASVESIGSCSLDVDGTGSESSGTADGRTSSISQRTLYSASVDLGSGYSGSQGPVTLTDKRSPHSPNKIYVASAKSSSSGQAKSTSEIRYVSELYIPNGQVQSAPDDSNDPNEHRKPSYINLSCSVSGYTSYSCYNSKVREGLRSRDNSPARLAFTAGSNGNGSLADELHTLDIEMTEDGEIKTVKAPTKLHTSSITLNVNNRVGDVVDRASRLSLYEEKRSSIYRASSEDGILNHNGGHSILKQHQETHEHYSATTVHMTQYESSEIIDRSGQRKNVNGDEGRIQETKSLIQQRIERLYGPGALAQGFRFHRERKTSESESSGGMPSKPPVSAKPITLKSKQPASRSLYQHFNEKPSKLTNGDMPKQQLATNGSDVNSSQTEVIANGKERTNGDSLYEDQRVDLLSETSLGNENLGSRNEQKSTASSKHAKWFIETMNKEKEKIKCLIAKAEQILKCETLSEDACGRIRAAIGKANLLLSQKFQQFKGLCEKNLTQSAGEQFPTTVEDLAGFWDMVLIQVADIHGMFEAIDKAHQEGWVVDEKDLVSSKMDYRTVSDGSNSSALVTTPKIKKVGLKKATSVTPQRSAKSAEASRAREEARRLLLEAKRRGRQQTVSQGDNSNIEIYVPDDKD